LFKTGADSGIRTIKFRLSTEPAILIIAPSLIFLAKSLKQERQCLRLAIGNPVLIFYLRNPSKSAAISSSLNHVFIKTYKPDRMHRSSPLSLHKKRTLNGVLILWS